MMQIRTIPTLAIALTAALAAPLVMAQSDSTSATSQNATARQPMSPLNSDISQATFTHLDKNRDGRISAAEARADSSFKSRFATLDSDHNGYVSASELNASGTASDKSAAGKSGATTMGNADWSSDSSGTNPTGTTSSSSSSDSQSDNGSTTPPPKP